MLSEKAQSSVVSNARPDRPDRPDRPAWLAKMLRVEWLGQTVASLCWIASVFVYGITSSGDYLQLCAASAWLIANLAVVVNAQDQ